MYFNLIFGLLGLLFTTVFLQHRWFIYVVGLLHFHSTVLCGWSFIFFVGCTFIVISTSRSLSNLFWRRESRWFDQYWSVTWVLSFVHGCRTSLTHIMMSHGLHESWQGRCRESFRFHGQPASADVGDSYYFLGSADIGRKWRRMSDISLYIRIRRLLQYFGDDE